MADVVAAISGGPRARLLIEAASRPGPVEPGSLLEAIKALRPAPTLPAVHADGLSARTAPRGAALTLS